MAKTKHILLALSIMITVVLFPSKLLAQDNIDPAGDVNGDGKVNIIDARWLLQASSGNRTLTAAQKAAGDVNGDGKINIIDARWLLQVSSGSRILNGYDDQMVWISQTGKKYHKIPNCGNMNPDKAKLISRSEAEAKGLTPCKNCYHGNITCSKVKFDHYDSDGSEYAVITGTDAAGNVMWTYETDKHQLSENSVFCDIGIHNGLYYFVETPAVATLSLMDGTVVWKSEDSPGTVSESAFGFCRNGDLIVSGYSGPDLYVVSPHGKTVKRIEKFDPDYDCPTKVEVGQTHAKIYFSDGPAGYSQNGYVFEVNLNDWTYHLIK